jgi:hypothetical protein
VIPDSIVWAKVGKAASPNNPTTGITPAFLPIQKLEIADVPLSEKNEFTILRTPPIGNPVSK